MEESTDDTSHSSYSPSLKHRLKNSLYACFKNTNHNQHHHHLDNNNNNNINININSPQHQQQQQQQHRTLLRSSSGGATGMMRHIINRIGTPRHGHHHHHHHRKSKSTDFRYDPHSYTLNFDDDDNAGFHEFPFRDFTSRLPPSPRPRPHPTRLNPPQPSPPPSSSPREIVACS